jgi:hypothetical protein
LGKVSWFLEVILASMADFKGSRIPYFMPDLSKDPTVFSNQHPAPWLDLESPAKKGKRKPLKAWA